MKLRSEKAKCFDVEMAKIAQSAEVITHTDNKNNNKYLYLHIISRCFWLAQLAN